MRLSGARSPAVTFEMPFVGPDYLLAWPPDLLVSEIEILLQRQVDDDWEESGRRLLGEAFEGSVPES
jgi:hypothetical protein